MFGYEKRFARTSRTWSENQPLAMGCSPHDISWLAGSFSSEMVWGGGMPASAAFKSRCGMRSGKWRLGAVECVWSFTAGARCPLALPPGRSQLQSLNSIPLIDVIFIIAFQVLSANRNTKDSADHGSHGHGQPAAESDS